LFYHVFVVNAGERFLTESRNITALNRISAVLGSPALQNFCFIGWISNRRENNLQSRKPDSCEIHQTPRRGQYLPIEEIHGTSSGCPIADLQKDGPLGWQGDHVAP